MAPFVRHFYRLCRLPRPSLGGRNPPRLGQFARRFYDRSSQFALSSVYRVILAIGAPFVFHFHWPVMLPSLGEHYANTGPYC